MLVKQILDTETGKLLVKNLSNKWVDVRVARVFFFFFWFVCLFDTFLSDCHLALLPKKYINWFKQILEIFEFKRNIV